MRAVGDEQPPCNIEPSLLQPVNFLQERDRIEYHAVTDDAAAAFPQHATGNELEDELLAADDNGVSGVVSASIAGDYVEALGEHVNNLAFTFIAPLGAHNYRGIASFQRDTPNDRLRTHTCSCHKSGTN